MICKHCKQPVHEATEEDRQGFIDLESPAYKHDNEMWTCIDNDCKTFAELEAIHA